MKIVALTRLTTRKTSTFPIVAVLIMIVTLCYADRFPAAQKDSLTRDSTVYDFIFLGARYQNQFTFLGRNYGQKIPFVTADLMYYTHFNLWVSVSGYSFSESSIPLQSAISIGYLGDLTKKIDYNLSFTEFLIPANDQITALQSLSFFQATIGLDWNYLYSTLQTQVMLYSSPDVFITSQHSRYFIFNKKLFNKIEVSFQPAFSFTLGTSRFMYSPDESLGGRGPRNPNAVNNPGNGNGNGNGNPGGGNPEEPDTSAGNRISFLSWDMALPITFQWGRFSLEYGIRYTHPLNVIEDDESGPTVIHGIDLYYHIPVKRLKKSKS